MTQWKKILNLQDVWNSKEWDDSNVQELGKIITKRMKKLYPDYEDYDKYGFYLEEMIDQFDNVLSNESYQKYPADYSYVSPMDEFNGYMEALYDWADGERLWVATNF